MVEDNFRIWWPEWLQNVLISHYLNDIFHHGWRTFWNLQNALISQYLNDLFHHGWRKFWNLMTWMPPKCCNFTLFELSSSHWKIGEHPVFQHLMVKKGYCFPAFPAKSEKVAFSSKSSKSSSCNNPSRRHHGWRRGKYFEI